jgi:DNA polymerase III alpha subunit
MTRVQELLAFPESFTRLEAILKPGNPLLLKVKIQVEEAGTRLSLQEARRLDQVAEKAATQEFRVRLAVSSLSEALLEDLEKLFAAAQGTVPVIFELVADDGSVAIVPSRQAVRITPELANGVARLRGDQAAA